MLKLYPFANYPSVQIAWDRAGTAQRICYEMELNQQLATQIPVYAYLFEDQNPPMYIPKMPASRRWPIIRQTSSSCFRFITAAREPHIPERRANNAVKRTGDRVTNFAATGNPDGIGNAPWPVYSANPGKSDILVENVPSLSTETTKQFNTAHNCGFWETLNK